MEPKVFYGLKSMPFMKESKYSKPYLSEDVKNMTDRLNYLKKVKGIGVFTGPPGSGKTSIVEGFAKKLNTSLYTVVYITMTTITSTEFLRQLAYAWGSSREAASATSSDRFMIPLNIWPWTAR